MSNPSASAAPWVGVIMGSRSDLKTMRPAVELLRSLEALFKG